MDHYWRTVPGQFTWPDFYAWLAGQVGDHACIVELGVFRGQSAACLGVELINAGKTGARVVLVDAADMGEALRNLDPIRSQLTVDTVRGISWESAKHFQDGTLDAVLIDADHSAEAVGKDITAWWPKVKSGGYLCGHDYTPEIPGVIHAVTAAFPRVEIWRGIRFKGTNGDQPESNYYPVWCVKK